MFFYYFYESLTYAQLFDFCDLILDQEIKKEYNFFPIWWTVY